MIYFCTGFMVGFFSCLLAVFIAVRMDLKKSIDAKKELLADRLILGNQIIGKDGYIPTGRGR